MGFEWDVDGDRVFFVRATWRTFSTAGDWCELHFSAWQKRRCNRENREIVLGTWQSPDPMIQAANATDWQTPQPHGHSGDTAPGWFQSDVQCPRLPRRRRVPTLTPGFLEQPTVGIWDRYRHEKSCRDGCPQKRSLARGCPPLRSSLLLLAAGGVFWGESRYRAVALSGDGLLAYGYGC